MPVHIKQQQLAAIALVAGQGISLDRSTNGNMPDMNQGDRVTPERHHLWRWMVIGMVLLALALAVALLFGRGSEGWYWAQGAQIDALMPWRWPRVVAALAAGMMLAVAGTMIQKLTGNPMASPEVLVCMMVLWVEMVLALAW